MEITAKNHSEWALIALNAAKNAAEKILEIYALPFDSIAKKDGSPVTLADTASNDILVKSLQQTNLPILSEESEHQPFSERKEWTSFWCIDPLDGTKEFIKKNDQFAINIALISNNVPVFGMIANPVKGTCIMGGIHQVPVLIEFENISCPDKWHVIPKKDIQNNPIVIASSYSPNNALYHVFLKKMNEKFGEVASIFRGSALKFFDLSLGNADVYPRFAPTMEWDIAAGHAILLAQGGNIFNTNTHLPLAYNKKDLRNPHFVAVTQPVLNSIHDEVLV